MLQGGAYLKVQCLYNKYAPRAAGCIQNMLLEHVGLKILLTMIHASGAFEHDLGKNLTEVSSKR